jgi:hypothetical protein
MAHGSFTRRSESLWHDLSGQELVTVAVRAPLRATETPRVSVVALFDIARIENCLVVLAVIVMKTSAELPLIPVSAVVGDPDVHVVVSTKVKGEVSQ